MSTPESQSLKFSNWNVSLDGAPVHFLHIRKTGGTAVAEALYPIARQYQIILHHHQTKLSDIPPDHKVFFFVRNPITRFVSGFYSRLRQGQPRHHYEWTAAERKAFQSFQRANDLAEALSSRDPYQQTLAEEAMLSIRHVNSRYRDWIGGTDELDARLGSILLIGTQETLARDFSLLKEILNLPSTINLPSDDVLAHRTPSGFDRNLSGVARENLASWYQEDVLLYEHCVRLEAARGRPTEDVRSTD